MTKRNKNGGNGPRQRKARPSLGNSGRAEQQVSANKLTARMYVESRAYRKEDRDERC
jgi:hypothetical protein